MLAADTQQKLTQAIPPPPPSNPGIKKVLVNMDLKLKVTFKEFREQSPIYQGLNDQSYQSKDLMKRIHTQHPVRTYL